jgi:hypothetical protein
MKMLDNIEAVLTFSQNFGRDTDKITFHKVKIKNQIMLNHYAKYMNP